VSFRLQRESRFVDLFVESAGGLVTAVELLAELLGADQPGREALAARMREVDQQVEASTHAVLRELSAAFVTPVDRIDVYRLAWALRACSRRIDALIDQATLFGLGQLPAEATDQVQLLARAADLTRDVMPQLNRMRALSEVWIELTRLRKQAGTLHRRMLTDLTAAGADPARLMRLSIVAQALQDVAQGFEDVAHALETIVVKET
jgi:uncharacterized protein Yka (UPF0111/DUF47 family)